MGLEKLKFDKVMAILQPLSRGPLLPVPRSEIERETLENAGHVSPRIWEMTKHNIEGGSGKSGVMVRICQPLPLLCFVISQILEDT